MARVGTFIVVALATALFLYGTTVTAAPVTFYPTDDATIRELRPTSNYGTNALLSVDLNERKDILLRFVVSGAAGRPVTKATLRLFVLDSSPIAGDVARTLNTSWSENTVTWATAPAADGGSLGALGVATAGVWVTRDVTTAVAGDGPVSFRVTSTSPNGADYASGENAAGNGPELVVEFGTAPTGDVAPPTAPTALQATAVTANRVSLSWGASTDTGGVTGYDVYRNGSLLPSSGVATTYDDTGVSPSTSYSYTVRARDAAGNVSLASNTLTVTTPSPDASPPTTPGGVVATAQCTFRLATACYAVAPVEIEVTWEPSQDDLGVVAYDVYRGGALIGSLPIPPGVPTPLIYEDFTAQPLSTYAYTVRARDASGFTSPPSAPASATTAGPESSPPTTPTSLAATRGTGTVVNLTWIEATDNTGVAGYEVFRDGSLIASIPASNRYIDATAPTTTPVTYWLRARDAFGNVSPASSSAVAPASSAVPTLTFAPTDDASVYESSPTRTYGLNPNLEVDQSSRKDTLLRFNLAGVSGRAVGRATLRLFVLDSSPHGGDVRVTSGTTWSEGSVTWSSAPAGDGLALGALGSVTTGVWVELDVTAAVVGDGPLSLRISSPSSNGADYASRQDTVGRGPRLVVDFNPTPPPTGQPAFPIRATFYYPWYPQTWTVNGAHVAYQPALGYYDSSDAAVQQSHIQAMTAAGLNAAISSWWGFPDVRDTRFAQLLDRTVALGSPLKWAAYHERESAADPTPAELATDLAHLRDLAASSAYLRVNGRFVVFVYNAQATDGCATVDRWRQANTLIANEAYIVMKTFSGREACPDQADSWHQYAPASATSQVAGQSYSVSPGFWRADEATPRLARDLARWQQNLRDMVASREPWQLVTTFNEWGEGTAIENEASWGTAYLDALAAALAPPPAPTGVVIAGAGDIGFANASGEPTARLLDQIRPSLVFTVGDNAYSNGSAADFTANYEPTWGRHRAITKPTAGNHDYLTPSASGYFGYFGAAAGSAGQGWYAYDVGGWRIYALNSNCSSVGGCGVGSPQYQWLANTLATDPRPCSIAYWHHPRFASGSKADDPSVQPLWALLHSAGNELVVAGHDHNYQRYAPQDAAGNLDYAGGMAQIIVGTGGSSSPVDPTGTNRLAANGDTRGVLKLTLSPGSYSWEFVPEAGKTFTDSGRAACH